MMLTALFTIHCSLFSSHAAAQRFFNLTAQEVTIDSLLPVFTYAYPVGAHYADSVYSVNIAYPEFIPMSEEEVKRYHAITNEPLKAMPDVSQRMTVSRKKGTLYVSFVPLVYHNGQYQKLVSFMLDIKGKKMSVRRGKRSDAVSRYAANSVLREGTWIKVCIPQTGIYQLTEDLIKKAGFSSLEKVKVYGYGGGLQPEKLTGDYLIETDDLKELPTCVVNGKKLFYGIGPVTWDQDHQRVRNPYSDYGYYFLTENDEESAVISTEEFLATYYPLDDDYCSLYEIDDYAWYHGGRNLYDAREMVADKSYTFEVGSTGTSTEGEVTINLTAEGGATVLVSVNDEEVGTIWVPNNGSLEMMRTEKKSFSVSNLQPINHIVMTPQRGSGTVRLDYISIYSTQPQGAPDLTATWDEPVLVGRITNQNYHAAEAADMIIVIPETQKLKAQAEQLKTLHETHDGMRVQIVPADELYNEFSSGTPDANAYRRYLKMLYDRAEREEDMPSYLLLLGDGAWDNRMVLSTWSSCSPEDFLLCYESENSYSETNCYVSDDYFCLLDDNEGDNLVTADKPDVAVGRISARTADEAQIAVDKIISYVDNKKAGDWQNTVCFMGDDGNQNQHMDDADAGARQVESLYPNLMVKRIMWDAYTRVSSSTGNSYPDVTRLIKQQMQQGALIMNYSGHGRADAISHEYVLRLKDFEESAKSRFPLWVTASCDIMPFDGQEENIGETAFFNETSGAIAFYGTTRTVYQSYNRLMNMVFMRYVLSLDESGRPMPIGEAVRQTKNELITTKLDQTPNKLQYSLLGDPALRLAIPTRHIRIDSINGTPIQEGTTLTLKAGVTATVSGHVENVVGDEDKDFDGVLTAVMRDVKEKVVCKLNDTSGEGAEDPFVYYDRLNTVYHGSDYVKNGRFKFTFAVPKDINYSDLTALMNLYAVDDDKMVTAHGICDNLVLNGSESSSQSTIGPNIYCYLNSTAFTNGGSVNSTPYFVAEISDEDGINASGSGIGHDLQLIIDGEMSKTYSLNDYFQYDFGSYQRGRVGFSIPALSYGQHSLRFVAWDVLNNASSSELTFHVEKGLEPLFIDVDCTPNPARTNTSFRVVHDRIGTQMDVKLDVYDTSGRHLWTHSENGVPADNTLSFDWDLTVDGGRKLHTGLYLYKISISSEGSSYASKTKKLIIFTHQ